MEEQNKARMEEQRLKGLEAKRLQDETKQKQEAERKKIEEEIKRKKEEQLSVQKVRMVAGKFRMVQPETFEATQAELVKVLQEELDKCHTQKQKVKEEADAAVKQAKERLEKLAEQKRKNEEMKAELERKRKEAIEKATELVKELAEFVEVAEEASQELTKEVKQLSDKDAPDMKMEEVSATVKGLNDDGAEAKEKVKACTEFVKEKGHEIRILDQPAKGEKLAEELPKLPTLMRRMSEATGRIEMAINSVAMFQAKAVKRNDAKKVAAATSKLFEKFDKDKDGMLSEKEVKQYAKSEFGFEVTADSLTTIWKFLVAGGDKGVKKAHFQKLKMSVGVAREKAKDDKRREARIKHEKHIATLKEELQEKVKDATTELEAADAKIKEAEKAAEPIPKSKSIASTLMVKLADEVDSAAVAGREAYTELKKSVAGLAEGIDPELKPWITMQVKNIEAKMARFEGRLVKVTTALAKFREEAKKKGSEELKAFEKRVVAMLKYHQRQSEGMSNDALFDVVDSGKDGKIDEAEFVAFLKDTCEKEEPAKAAEKDGKEAKAEAAKEAKAEAAEPEQEALSEEDLRRAFAHLDDDEEGFIARDKFYNLVRVFMKVSKDTVVTGGLSIKESKTMRRLEVGEVVECLEGPRQEDTVKVPRIRVKVMKDNIEGWVTMAGNQGTKFLEVGGSIFKVVAETILTETFALDGSGAKASTRRLKDTTRKLKVGETVEVREWPKKEEQSGLMRMKCRTKSDGITGFVTTVGNQGTVYLEVV